MATIQEHSMAAAQFKAKCLKEIDLVHSSGKPLVITKHGKPLVKIIPIHEEEPCYFGCLKDSLEIVEDITLPIDEVWDAEKDNR